jgi:hypothetical protein
MFLDFRFKNSNNSSKNDARLSLIYTVFGIRNHSVIRTKFDHVLGLHIYGNN